MLKLTLGSFLQCSDQATAAAGRLAVPTSFRLSSLSESRHEPQALTGLVHALTQVASGSLVAASLLRALLHDRVCSRLGTSHAYRLASSVRVALELGQKSEQLLAEHAAAFSSAAGACTAALRSYLAAVLCMHLDAVDCGCQLLRQQAALQLLSMQQQAGTQLHQVLQRTVCHPLKLIMFCYTSLEALAEVEKACTG